MGETDLMNQLRQLADGNPGGALTDALFRAVKANLRAL